MRLGSGLGSGLESELDATSFYDISPKNQPYSSTKVVWLLDTRKGDMKANIFVNFLACKSTTE